MDGVGLVSCDVFLVGGACAYVLVDGAGSYLSEDSAVSSSRFWSVCAFSMRLGSRSSFHGVRSIYFHSCLKAALSAKLQCRQPLPVPGIIATASGPLSCPAGLN